MVKFDNAAFKGQIATVGGKVVNTAEVRKVLSGGEITALQQLVKKIPVSEHVIRYAVELVRSTRPGSDGVLQYVKDWISWGAGPRASQYLILGAKTQAALDGRYSASIEDVRAVAIPVLRHRIVTNFNAEAEGIGTLEIIGKLLEDVPHS